MSRDREAVRLWHPDSPGMRVWVKPCLLRRLGVIRSEFATLSEVLLMYKVLSCDYRMKRGWKCSRLVGHDGPCALSPRWWNLRRRWLG